MVMLGSRGGSSSGSQSAEKDIVTSDADETDDLPF
jgi:hypothetical protein